MSHSSPKAASSTGVVGRMPAICEIADSGAVATIPTTARRNVKSRSASM